LAVHNHHDTYKVFPTNGTNLGDDDGGYGTPIATPTVTGGTTPAGWQSQTLGWLYQILPFLEQTNVWNQGVTNGALVAGAIIPSYTCPSRRGFFTYNTYGWTEYHSDYAGNGGSTESGRAYNRNGGNGVISWNYNTQQYVTFMGAAFMGTSSAGVAIPQGVPATYTNNGLQSGYMANPVTIASITDGTSNTILAGEKYISTIYYQPGNYGGYPLQWGDLNGYTNGVGWDNTRWGVNKPMQDNAYLQYNGCYQPPGATTCTINAVDMFGGPHAGGSQMVMCDGGVRTCSWQISLAMIAAYTNRNDGVVVDDSIQ